MRKALILILITAVPGIALSNVRNEAQSGPSTQAAEKSKLQRLADKLESLAEEWKKGRLNRPPHKEEFYRVMRDLKRIRFDEKRVEEFKQVLAEARPDDVKLFVVNKLCTPLLLAKTETIREILPPLREIHQHSGQFERVPQYSEKQLKTFRYEKGDSAERRKLARKRQHEKIQTERDIERHNELVGEFKNQLFELMVYADQPRYDDELLDIIRTEEKKRHWTFTYVLDAIRAEIRHMEQDRAKRLYEKLRVTWVQVRDDAKKKYADLAHVKVNRDKNSEYEIHEEAPGPLVLKVINLLATQAKMPALVNPKGKKGGGKRLPGQEHRHKRK